RMYCGRLAFSATPRRYSIRSLAIVGLLVAQQGEHLVAALGSQNIVLGGVIAFGLVRSDRLRQPLGSGFGCVQRADDAWTVHDVGDVIPADRDALVPAIDALHLRPQRLDLCPQ